MKRQPRGTPVGGQFAEDRRPEGADLTIAPIKTSDVFGNTTYTVNGILHREDGPAAIGSDGSVAYYRNGMLHRLDGPAVIRADGDMEWWTNGEIASAQPAPPEREVTASEIFHDHISPTPIDSRSEAVQRGEVFNTVAVVDDYIMNGEHHTSITNYCRRRDGVFAGTPYSMRIQTSRPITDDEMHVMAGLVGYAYRSTVAGESMGLPGRDSPYSFVIYADTTKSSRDDLGQALSEFENVLPTMIAEGSPVRKTNRAGKGTQGTRLVNGLGDDLKFELYYDDVWDDNLS